MKELIREKLKQVERDKGVEILYACESGSRAWGFASPDSDWDVRFIYRKPLSHYLSVSEPRDVIELAIEKDDGGHEWDINGWDVKKSLVLLRKSNPTLLEWLSSPIVYMENENFSSSMRMLADQGFNDAATAFHYLNMAKNNVRKDLDKGRTSGKKYLYVIRALLSVRYVFLHKSMPPILFSELVCKTLNMDVLDDRWLSEELEKLLDLKGKNEEKFILPVNLKLQNWIDKQIEFFWSYDWRTVKKPLKEGYDQLLYETLVQS